MLVSVIIPCYNVSQYIQQCIESVIAQTYKNIEIICVDNNSTDDTWNVLNQLKIKYPQLILEIELKPGACATRNKGMSISMGEWIQFLDADDLLLPTKIEHQVNLIQNNKSNDFLFIAGAYIKQNSQKINYLKKDVNLNEIFISILSGNAGNTCSNLWISEKIKKINGWDDNLKSSQETDLMFRLFHFAQGTILHDNLYNTIIRERDFGQISQQNNYEKWKRFLDVRIKYIEMLNKNNIDKYLKIKNQILSIMLYNLFIVSKFDLVLANYYYKYLKIKKIYIIKPLILSKKKYYLFKLFGFKLTVKIIKFFNLK